MAPDNHAFMLTHACQTQGTVVAPTRNAYIVRPGKSKVNRARASKMIEREFNVEFIARNGDMLYAVCRTVSVAAPGMPVSNEEAVFAMLEINLDFERAVAKFKEAGAVVDEAHEGPSGTPIPKRRRTEQTTKLSEDLIEQWLRHFITLVP